MITTFRQFSIYVCAPTSIRSTASTLCEIRKTRSKSDAKRRPIHCFSTLQFCVPQQVRASAKRFKSLCSSSFCLVSSARGSLIDLSKSLLSRFFIFVRFFEINENVFFLQLESTQALGTRFLPLFMRSMQLALRMPAHMYKRSTSNWHAHIYR